MIADGEARRVWQIAAGDGPDRDYAPIFLRYGLAAVGPGDPGPYDENPQAYEVAGWAHRPFLSPFRYELEEGDLLLLKRPAGRNWEILAVGQVDGPYQYEPRLGDVEGWDLQHCRRVRWRRLQAAQTVAGLVRGTLKRVKQESLRRLACELWADGTDLEPHSLPEPAGEVDDEQVIGLLIDHGVSSSVAETTAQTLRRLRRLADWYAKVGEGLGEHEIRTFVVVPLLLALGWPEQRMRIEYRRADIALSRARSVKLACVWSASSKRSVSITHWATRRSRKPLRMPTLSQRVIRSWSPTGFDGSSSNEVRTRTA